MDEPQLKITHRNLPHWTLPGSMYFVTFRLARGTLSASERSVVLKHLTSGHKKFYLLAAAVVMPDHVHLLIKPLGEYTLSRVMKGIKGVSARLLNQLRDTQGTVWQDESWDRIVRDAEEFQEKLQYMANNPVKSGLVQEGEKYAAWFLESELV